MSTRATRHAFVREHTGSVVQERIQRERHDLTAIVNELLRRVDALEAVGRPVGDVGRYLKAMSDANQTLTAAQARRTYIRATGTLTAGRTLTFPFWPKGDEDTVFRMFQNNTAGGFNVTVASLVTSGATVAVAAGVTRWLGFTSGGVFLVL
jgi:hypothetical protein